MHLLCQICVSISTGLKMLGVGKDHIGKRLSVLSIKINWQNVVGRAPENSAGRESSSWKRTIIYYLSAGADSRAYTRTLRAKPTQTFQGLFSPINAKLCGSAISPSSFHFFEARGLFTWCARAMTQTLTGLRYFSKIKSNSSARVSCLLFQHLLYLWCGRSFALCVCECNLMKG